MPTVTTMNIIIMLFNVITCKIMKPYDEKDITENIDGLKCNYVNFK